MKRSYDDQIYDRLAARHGLPFKMLSRQERASAEEWISICVVKGRPVNDAARAIASNILKMRGKV